MCNSQDRKYKRIVCKMETQVDWGKGGKARLGQEVRVLAEETDVRTRT